MTGFRSTEAAVTTTSKYSVLRTVAAAAVALAIGATVSIVGRKLGWPHSQSIGLATFLFCIPVLPTLFRSRGARSLPQAVVVGVMFAVIGGLIHAFVLDR
jgi:hypothetical protein